MRIIRQIILWTSVVLAGLFILLALSIVVDYAN